VVFSKLNPDADCPEGWGFSVGALLPYDPRLFKRDEAREWQVSLALGNADPSNRRPTQRQRPTFD